MELKKLVNDAKTIGVIGHIDPDSDSLGSVTALAESMRLLDKKVYAFSLDPVPYNIKFLYKSEELIDDLDADVNLDILFILDTSNLERMGKGSRLLSKSKATVIIDHHISNNMKADIKYLDTTVSSTGELLYSILDKNNFPIDKNIGESILTAISGDSGSFRYDTVTDKTFDITSDLMKLGVDLNKINTNLYGQNRLQKVEMLGRALSRLKLHKNGRISTTYILGSDFMELEAERGDIEGIVETIRDISGVEIAIFIRETREGLKVSTRSKHDYDVRKLALKFGGGGHVKAAGFSLDYKNIEEAFDIILEKICL